MSELESMESEQIFCNNDRLPTEVEFNRRLAILDSCDSQHQSSGGPAMASDGSEQGCKPCTVHVNTRVIHRLKTYLSSKQLQPQSAEALRRVDRGRL